MSASAVCTTIRAAEEPLLSAIGARLRLSPRRVSAPTPQPLIEALVIGPTAETARRWLSGAHDVDLAQAARILPDRIWRSLRPE
ncbi:hypothetical protein ACFV0D_35260 [Streptomyces sp. NPDC059556]|uniref:hypothetical protein n=1 Tax=Streptomyces sp. NPDC059556 TaxID=3346863 RepID=UPI003695CB7D